MNIIDEGISSRYKNSSILNLFLPLNLWVSVGEWIILSHQALSVLLCDIIRVRIMNTSFVMICGSVVTRL